MKNSATNKSQVQKNKEPKFFVSNRTIEILDDFIRDENDAFRMKGHVIEILLKLRERDQNQGHSGNDCDIIFYFLDQLIDSILLDKGIKNIDNVVPF